MFGLWHQHVAMQLKWDLFFFVSEAYKMKVMGVVGKGNSPHIRAIEPGDVAGMPRHRCPRWIPRDATQRGATTLRSSSLDAPEVPRTRSCVPLWHVCEEPFGRFWDILSERHVFLHKSLTLHIPSQVTSLHISSCVTFLHVVAVLHSRLRRMREQISRIWRNVWLHFDSTLSAHGIHGIHGMDFDSALLRANRTLWRTACRMPSTPTVAYWFSPHGRHNCHSSIMIIMEEFWEQVLTCINNFWLWILWGMCL